MSSSELDVISRGNRDNPDECFREVIKYWLRGSNHKCTWSGIVSALRARSVGYLCLARSIEQQYMETNHPEEIETEVDDNSGQADEIFHCPCCRCSLESYLEEGCQSSHSNVFPYLDVKNLDEDIKDDLIQTLTNDLAEIMTCFAELLDNTAMSIRSRGDPTAIVERLTFRALGLGAYDHPRIQKPLLREDEVELKCSKTVDAAFIILRRHMSFFNFELLQYIINCEELCTNNDRKRMEEYCSKFDKFCRRKVFEVPPDSYGQPRSDGKRKSFVVLMTRHEEEQNLVCVRAVKHKIANILKLKYSTLHLHRIDEGSLILVFSVPEFVAQCLFPLDDLLKAELKAKGFTIFSSISSAYCLSKDREMETVKPLKVEGHTSPSSTLPFNESSLSDDRDMKLVELSSYATPADYPYYIKKIIVHYLGYGYCHILGYHSQLLIPR